VPSFNVNVSIFGGRTDTRKDLTDICSNFIEVNSWIRTDQTSRCPELTL
jgi:hypothetical protein